MNELVFRRFYQSFKLLTVRFSLLAACSSLLAARFLLRDLTLPGGDALKQVANEAERQYLHELGGKAGANARLVALMQETPRFEAPLTPIGLLRDLAGVPGCLHLLTLSLLLPLMCHSHNE